MHGNLRINMNVARNKQGNLRVDLNGFLPRVPPTGLQQCVWKTIKARVKLSI